MKKVEVEVQVERRSDVPLSTLTSALTFPEGGYPWQMCRSMTASLKFSAWRFKTPRRHKSLPHILKFVGQK
jgi:hypothetical protein